MGNVFETVDETAKEAAKTEYHTFSSLVRVLVKYCTSELDKARAIFRYITEKKFGHRNWFLFYPEEGNTRGAPTDLLRGVEFGIETKALLYKRMCAYAGLHAIVIKGFCKAKEYKPSEEFVDNRWQRLERRLRRRRLETCPTKLGGHASADQGGTRDPADLPGPLLPHRPGQVHLRVLPPRRRAPVPRAPHHERRV